MNKGLVLSNASGSSYDCSLRPQKIDVVKWLVVRGRRGARAEGQDSELARKLWVA